MSLFRVQFGIIGRSTGGSALRRSAYQRCTSESGFNFSSKAAELRQSFMVMPAGAPAWAHDPQQLWSQVEAAEKRKDSQISRTIEITIPRPLPDEMQEEFIRHCLQPLIQKGMAAEVAIQNKVGFDGQENPHAHVQLTMRKFTDRGDGFGAKERTWNTLFRADQGRKMRGQFAERMNDFMKRHGIDAHVDHRSYKERGIDRPSVPEVPKRHWKQWERMRERHPSIRPPDAIVEYQKWRHNLRHHLAKEAAIRKEIEELERHENNEWDPVEPTRRPAATDLRSGPRKPESRGRDTRPDPEPGRRRGGGSDHGNHHHSRRDTGSTGADRTAARNRLAAAQLRARLDIAQLRPTPVARRKAAAAAYPAERWIGQEIKNVRQAAGLARRWRQQGFQARFNDVAVLIRGGEWQIADYGNRCLIDTATDEAVAVLIDKARREWEGAVVCHGSEKFLQKAWLEAQRQGVDFSVRDDPSWQPPAWLKARILDESEATMAAPEPCRRIKKEEPEIEAPRPGM